MKLFKEKKYRKYFLVPFIFLGIIAVTGAVTGSCGGGPPGGDDGRPPDGGPTGKLYVSGCSTNSILSYDNANSVSGSATVSRTISGATTTLSTQGGIFVDVANNRLYVANYTGNSILVFDNASAANNNIAPDRTIAGVATTLEGPADVFVDVANNRLYVANFRANSILVFDNVSTASGNVTPDRTISGILTTLDRPAGIYVASNMLYINNRDGNKILIYNNASTAYGNFLPSRTISGVATTLNWPVGVFVDATNNRLYVANYLGNSILVFDNANSAAGDILPSRTITGVATTLGGPADVFVDVTNNLLYVANYGADSILVFNNAGTTSGDIAPNRTINVPAGSTPVSVFVDITR